MRRVFRTKKHRKQRKQKKGKGTMNQRPLYPGVKGKWADPWRGESQQLPLGTGTPSYQPKPPCGTIKVVNADGADIFTATVAHVDDDWWGVASAVYPPDEQNVMTIPESAVHWREEAVGFNACTFDATDDYMQAQWGKRLDSNDKDWAKYHPLATDGGIPQEYTADVLHGLVEPYGFGVDRIRVPKGALLLGGQATKWILALGCNPYAMVDHSTTNEEAIARLKADGVPEAELPTLEAANALWRFEFGDEPLRPSVVGMAGYTGPEKVGFGMGHAKYLSYRAPSASGWKVSVQLAPLSQIRYTVPPDLLPYTRRHGKLSLKLEGIDRPDGRPVAVMRGGHYVDPDAASPTAPALAATSDSWMDDPYDPYDSDLPLVPGEHAGGSASEPLIHCYACSVEMSADEMMPGMLLCQDCYADAWSGFRCPTCHHRFDSDPPEYDHKHGFLCSNPACSAVFDCSEDESDHLVMRQAMDDFDRLHAEDPSTWA